MVANLDQHFIQAFQYMADNLAKKKEGQQIIVLQRILSSDDVNFGYDEGEFEAHHTPP